jgi:hypothetical protein
MQDKDLNMKRALSTWLMLFAALGLSSSAHAQDAEEGHDHEHESQAAQPATPTIPSEGGKLSLSMDKWDFGVKWYGEDCAVEVVLSNTGTGPLTISNVKSSCGCTVAKPKSGGVWTNKVLKPGETESMSLSYNTKKGAKKVSQTVTIESNDAERPRLAFSVKGEVKDVYEAKPFNRVTFGRVERDSVATQVIELTNNMEEKVFLKLKPQITTEKQPFTVQLEETEAGTKYKLIVTTNPPLAIGGNTLTVEIETGVAKMPTMSVPVSAFITPRVTVSPPRLYMSPKVSKAFQKIVRVNYTADKPVKIVEVKSSHPSVTAEVIESRAPEQQANRPQQYHEVRISLPAAEQFPEEGATVTIITDDPSPEYQKLEVPIMTQAQFRASASANSPTLKEPLTSSLRPQQAPRPEGGRKPDEAGAKPDESKDQAANPDGEKKDEQKEESKEEKP